MSNVKQEGYLFVYGTLKKGQQRFPAIGGFVTDIEKVQLPGFCMYDLGAFPAIICTHSMDNVVIGELVKVDDIAAVLKRCDSIEGYIEGSKSNLYERVKVEVQDMDGFWMGTSHLPVYTYEFANHEQIIVNYSGKQLEEWPPKKVVEAELNVCPDCKGDEDECCCTDGREYK